ncbi:MAG: thioredoxin-disulfide reductase [Candidatus Omnitrophica bacterium]|nr:thioredoxin-disulfide reductase [Candidatus Omnitrophota bacterium]
MYDLVIIGAGPAGLTAGLYAGRFRLTTLILEKLTVGGRILLTETIENFPGFYKGISSWQLIQQMEKQVKDLAVEFRIEEVRYIDCNKKILKTDKATYTAKALIIATGARAKRLNVEGEEKFIGKGVSYCAICDAPLYKEKEVVIVGGGDAVAEEALYLARFAKSVKIIHRREQLRASQILKERLKENKKIDFILNSIVTEIIGQDKVKAVRIRNKDTEKQEVIACEAVFIYIGYEPETALIKGQIKLDEADFIITDEKMQTSQEGVFACGDCCKKDLYQVITACAEGAIAANSAYKYITQKK